MINYELRAGNEKLNMPGNLRFLCVKRGNENDENVIADVKR